MKLLNLTLFVSLAAHASFLASVDAFAGNASGPFLSCGGTYTAPPYSFDIACTVPNPSVPSNFAWSEVAARGPMHVFLENIGGSTDICVVGCTEADANIQYNDVWTITGDTGAGTLGLFLMPGGAVRPYPATFTNIEVQGRPGTFSPYQFYVPFVYGVPFAFSFTAVMDSGLGGYGQSTLSLDGKPTFYEGSCSDPLSCGQLPAIAGTVTSGVGDPFLELPPATLVIIPEPATIALTAWFLAGVFSLLVQRDRKPRPRLRPGKE